MPTCAVFLDQPGLERRASAGSGGLFDAAGSWVGAAAAQSLLHVVRENLRLKSKLGLQQFQSSFPHGEHLGSQSFARSCLYFARYSIPGRRGLSNEGCKCMEFVPAHGLTRPGMRKH
jgi:hypothetical protein